MRRDEPHWRKKRQDAQVIQLRSFHHFMLIGRNRFGS